MQTSISSNGLRFVGKSWEIRNRLRELSKHPITVHEFLQRQSINRPKLKQIIFTPSTCEH